MHSALYTFWTSYFEPHAKRRIGYAFLLSLFAALCNALVPFLFKGLVDQFDTAEVNSKIVIYFVVLYGAIWTCYKLITPLQFRIILSLVEQSIQTISQKVFTHLHNLSMRFHLHRSTGAITGTIERAQMAIEVICYGMCVSIVPTVLDFLFTLGVFGYWYSPLYGVVLILLIICSLYFGHRMLGQLEQQQQHYHKKQNAVRQKLLDSLLNYETVKYFTNETYEQEQFGTLLRDQKHAGKAKHTTEWRLQLGQHLLFGLGLLCITWHSAHQLLEGTIQLGDFVLINSHFLRLIIPIEYLGSIIRHVKKACIAVEELTQLMATPPEIYNAPNARPLKPGPLAIRFHAVNFGYQPDKLILSQLSFTVAVGKTVALVGASGSGKSTIAKLLFRLYDVDSGTIFINGQDTRSITLQSLRKSIGIVAQEINLFNDTFYNNVAYARPTASQEEVESAIRSAQLDTLVHGLPNGYHTMIGERGLKLSGGEKQRLAIARAVLKQAELYIFDESTSQLDSNTEATVQRNLTHLFADKTILIIAHRLCNIAHANQIIVLGDGLIMQQGTHESLIATPGTYQTLWQKQSRYAPTV